MNFPSDLKYTKNDEWIRAEGDEGAIGISDYAQDQLSDIVFIEYSVDPGDTIKKGDTIGIVESVKAASDVYSPVSGEVIAVNDVLLDAPETVNSDPFGSAWMVRIKLSDASELEAMMDAAAYETYTKERDA